MRIKMEQTTKAFSLIIFVLLCVFSAASSHAQSNPAAPSLKEEQLSAISGIIEKAISSDQIPGAVVLVGSNDRVLFRKAFGYRSVDPKKMPMTFDTIFDLASLTKVIATTTAIMQLVEKGSLRLEDTVSEYWPEFKTNGKDKITVRELLTHYSGLRPDLDMNPKWSGYAKALKLIINEKPVSTPGTRFLYSDINFEILGELVHIISGKTLDVYCAENIFKPLGMKDTVFKPSSSLHKKIAPAESGKVKTLPGEVNDPTAHNMGGVAGHAGLFSTADDLSVFAQMLLSGGSMNNKQILSPLIVEKMTTPQTPPDKMVLRGLGWDIDSPFSSNRGELFPVGSFGHTGYTGTSIWIDPVSNIYVIVLTTKLHPNNNNGAAVKLRSEVSSVVASAIGPVSSEKILASRRSITGYYELMKSYRVNGLRNGKVQTGIDVLEAKKFASLKGLRIGLITNHSGVDAEGQRTIDLLYKAPNLKLKAVFSPEHGITGKNDEKVASATDAATGLPVYSLYGDIKYPTEKMLEDLDALVFDMQDTGARFYTYMTTMGYAMEAAAKKGISFYVLDRPNPITGSIVQGPVSDENFRSFTSYFPLPVRHGMTIGELAGMFNTEKRIGAKLNVLKMHGYERTDWYDETGLNWINPSPNLRTLTEAVLYPGVALAEGANVSVGRGTATPFELLGAPWIDAKKLSSYLNSRRIQGVRFMPMDFTPDSNTFKNELCHGVQIILVDRQALDPTVMGIEIISALYKLFPADFKIDKTSDIICAGWILQAIKNENNPDSIVMQWQASLEQFRKLRSRYLIY